MCLAVKLSEKTEEQSQMSRLSGHFLSAASLTGACSCGAMQKLGF